MQAIALRAFKTGRRNRSQHGGQLSAGRYRCGIIGPTGEIFEPVGIFSHAEAVETFHEQAEGLKDGGVDALAEPFLRVRNIWPRQKLLQR